MIANTSCPEKAKFRKPQARRIRWQARFLKELGLPATSVSHVRARVSSARPSIMRAALATPRPARIDAKEINRAALLAQNFQLTWKNHRRGGFASGSIHSDLPTIVVDSHNNLALQFLFKQLSDQPPARRNAGRISTPP